MTTTKSVVFDRWTGGEFGSASSRDAGKLNADGRIAAFTAKNMLRYRDGLMGPRAGMKSLGITSAPNGALKALGGSFTEFWFVVGSTAYHVARTGGAVSAYTMTDSIAGTFVYPGEVADAGTVSYLLVFGDAAYKIDHGTHTVTKLTGTDSMPAGRACLFYQDRLLVAGSSSEPQRLFFSEPGGTGWESFPALNYVDVPGFALTSLLPYRNGLLVGSAGGTYSLITGSLGVDSITRQITRQGCPGDPPKGAALATDEVVYMGQSKPWVTVFNGALHYEIEDLRFAGDNYTGDTDATPTFRLLKLLGPDDWLALSGLSTPAEAVSRALVHNGSISPSIEPSTSPASKCSYHTWEQPIGAWALELGGSTDEVLLVKDGDGSHPCEFFIWTARLDRPGFVGDDSSQPGDGSDTPIQAFLHTAELFADDGSELLVRKVIVDFRKWDTGNTITNHFELSVKATQRYNTVEPSDSARQPFDELPSAVTDADGFEDESQTFNVGDQGYAHGFRIIFDEIRGVAIRSVTVVYDEQPSRG